jgi:hypothetical protein
MHVQPDDNTVTIDYNPPATFAFVTRLILKLPLLIYLPFLSYILTFRRVMSATVDVPHR